MVQSIFAYVCYYKISFTKFLREPAKLMTYVKVINKNSPSEVTQKHAFINITLINFWKEYIIQFHTLVWQNSYLGFF